MKLSPSDQNNMISSRVVIGLFDFWFDLHVVLRAKTIHCLKTTGCGHYFLEFIEVFFSQKISPVGGRVNLS